MQTRRRQSGHPKSRHDVDAPGGEEGSYNERSERMRREGSKHELNRVLGNPIDVHRDVAEHHQDNLGAREQWIT